MKLPDFEIDDCAQKIRAAGSEHIRQSCLRSSTNELEATARACIDELRNRGRSLGLDAEGDLHETALRAIERLAASASAVELIARGELANDNARGE